MIGLIFMGIFASVVVMGAIGVLMFADVAHTGPNTMRARWLPLLNGAPLRAWAALRSRFATSEWLASHPDRTPSEDLARCIEADTGEVLDQAVFQESPEARGMQRCQQATSVPQVTPPEVFAIAAELQKLPSARLQDLISQMGSDTCPLLTKQGMCLCAIARPIECRGRCLAGFDTSADAMKWANDLEEGMIDGLQKELSIAGLDGRRYDINRAMARILTDPAAAEAGWRRGERLLPTGTE